MRNCVRKMTAFVTAISMTMASGVTVNAAGWKQDGKGWWFENTDGTYVSNTWKQVNGKWYAFDSQGYMRTGWFQENGKWYYLDYSGAMQTGWIKENEKWYYMGADGVCFINTKTPDGYMVDANGAWTISETPIEAETKLMKTYVEEKGIVFEEIGSFLFHTMSYPSVGIKKEYEVPSTISYQIIEKSETTKTYKIIVTMQFDWVLGGSAGYHLFDTYSGMVLPNPPEGNKDYVMGSFEQYSTKEVILFDEKECVISYVLGIDYSQEALATLTYTVQVPAEYNGLGYIQTSGNEWDKKEKNIDKITILEETDLLDEKEIHFFKIGE